MINKKPLIFTMIGLIIVIGSVFFINSLAKDESKEITLSPNSGGGSDELYLKDEKLYLYNNMTTPTDYDNFKKNVKLFIANKGGKVNDSVEVTAARERIEGQSYPRYVTLYIPSLDSSYEVKVDYNEDKSGLLFIIESENYSSDLDLKL